MDALVSRRFAWSETHPFLSFTFDRDRMHPETWALLGECSSKIEHISRVPLRPDTAQHLFTIFLVKGIHGTTAIEGNTLSEEQVAKRLGGKLKLPPSQEYLGTEVDNIVKAYSAIIENLQRGAPTLLCADDLKNSNRTVLKNTVVEDHVVPGEFRDNVVRVNNYTSPSPQHTEQLVSHLCSWMNDSFWNEVVGSPYVYPILKAIMAHLYIAWIHPFGDGNGRTARLLEFDILTRAGVPPISAHLLSDHYNKTRLKYYRALSAAQDNEYDFVRYALEGFVDGLREQLERIWTQQIQVTWTNYVHGVFRKMPGTAANARRRDIAITLGHREEPVAVGEISGLRPEFTVAYSNSQRMLQRDLNVLLSQGLIARTEGGGVKARVELLQAFLPIRQRATARDAA
jgi:Fic family protein